MPDDLHRRYVDLAQPRLGSQVVYATDDFFADKSRLISPEPPQFIPGKYDDNGKWMDGWESRRKRAPGHDWCVVRLGVPGEVAGFEVDTSHFTGNYPPAAMIEVCRSDEAAPGDEAAWVAVKGLTRAEILATFEARLANDSDTEFATAIAQIHRIAGFRLAELT